LQARYAQVVVDAPERWADGLYTYELPPELWESAQPGCAVLVPFGKRQLTGYLIDCSAEKPANTEVKPVSELLSPQPVWPSELRELALWMADVYTCTLAEAFQTVVAPSILRRLLKPPRKRARRPTVQGLGETLRVHQLNDDQAAAVSLLAQTLQTGGTVLLEGITGSGKTEVYLHAIERALAAGSGAIVLVPEVALTPQAIDRYRGRLGEKVALLHSQLGDAERAEQWQLLHSGQARVALGTRSAVFAPVQDLGLIIIDEEHDNSYKQDSTPRYHARQVAAWRSERRKPGCGLVLGSATPCLETYSWARRGHYGHARLTSRAAGTPLPPVELIDLRQHRLQGRSDLSRPLVAALEGTLDRGEQAVLLFNRRGFSRYLQCQDCGEALQCPHCSICLTVHQAPPRLLCHYCGHQRRPPDTCSACGSNHLAPKGSGTERLEEEVAQRVRGASVLRMDRDTTGRQGAHGDILRRFANREANILLGTQMVAKGLDFPSVTLVGVVGADHGLHLPDFRAAERTLQLLIQVAGRSGRGTLAGRTILQAFDADHPVFGFARRHDYAGFLAEEVEQRRILRYPPFCRLARLLISGEDPQQVQTSLAVFQSWFSGVSSDVEMIGPAPCPVEKIKGMFRFHFLFKARKVKDLSEILRNALRQCKRSSSVRWTVDIDPQNLL
jgi:primosomal protein N' (replication factor Y) (superfamily II helicase)